MNERLFSQGDRVGVLLPEGVASRYHLVEGVEMEIVQMEEGILLRPLDVEPWFSVEWERALDTVLEWYGEALEQIGE